MENNNTISECAQSDWSGKAVNVAGAIAIAAVAVGAGYALIKIGDRLGSSHAGEIQLTVANAEVSAKWGES